MTSLSSRPLVEGPLAIDLLNTEWQEGPTRVDWLDSDAAISQLHRENGHHGADDATHLNEQRDALGAAREIVKQLFEGPGSTDALEKANELLQDARITLVSNDGAVRRSVTTTNPSNALAVEALLNAVSLVETSPQRIRQCTHDHCVLWFVDTSKAGRRKWCSMDTCGNRSKANRHYQRTRQTSEDD